MSVKKMYVNSAKNRVAEVHTMKNGVKECLYRFKNKYIENGILKPDSNIVIHSVGGSSSLVYKNLLATYDDMVENNEIISADGTMTINKTLSTVPATVFIYNESFAMESAEFGTKHVTVGAIPYAIDDVVTNMDIKGAFTLKLEFDAVSSHIWNGETVKETTHVEETLDAYYIKKRKLTINGFEKEVCGVEIMIPVISTAGTSGLTVENYMIALSISDMYTFNQ